MNPPAEIKAGIQPIQPETIGFARVSLVRGASSEHICAVLLRIIARARSGSEK